MCTSRSRPATPGALRRFVAALLVASPRNAIASVAAMLILSVVEGVGILMLVPLLGLVGVDAGQGSLGGVVSAFGSAFTWIGVRPTLPIVLGLYIALAVLQSMLQRWQATLNVVVQHDFVTALRRRVYRAIAGAKWSFLARSRSSDGIHYLTHEIDQVGGAAANLVTLVVTGAVAVVYFAVALRVSPVMTLLVLACGGALALGVRAQLRRARVSGEALSNVSRRVHGAITDHLASLKTARSYGAAARHTEIFTALIDEQRSVQARAVQQYAGMRQQLAIGVPVVLAVVVYVSYGVLGVPTASLFVLLFLFARLMPRLTSLLESAQTFAQLLPAFTQVTDFEARCLEAAEPTGEPAQPVALRHQIELERVTFTYEGAADCALRDVSLAIDAGATTAIVGPSGAGKSTLVDLLLGLLTPSSGRLLIDGTPLDPSHLASWRSQIGYVPQDTFLFHDSVRGNLLWARPDAPEEELWRALRLASADGFVSALPKGLDTLLGERGILLSGGERQRLSLARALLRRPAVLILDEATSSLDSENELRIQEAIDGLHEQLTIVVITHRLSTIRNADRIHVIDRGRLEESGTWDDLIRRPDGRFLDLCMAQGMDATTKNGRSLPEERVERGAPVR